MAKEASAPPSPLKGGRPPAVKSGGRRVSKKQENGAVEKNSKNLGKEKTSSIVSVTKMQNMGVLLADALEKISHKFPAAAAQMAHQKPRPALQKSIWPKRIYIIQQPRKC
ncbi:death-associated protein-like 1 isoform X1 [Gopherus flavomarginatus]|uniref:Death associated protein like 1 n=1 Tax=Gopherus evgoodei TaxID=1825980 RepID=A0A8C4YPI6_9SAUR|nr:death-associated protein-like 1 isoform X1 [Gopherus evgoodei]XP_050825329.1 death-associated protein-like 1 isoform X1 [Gopherus flavomarginatus]